jgi:polyisoprenoid-binding protein YceI
MAKWVMDASHSLVEFSVKHMMIANVKGRFSKFEGTIDADPANLAAASLNVTVDAASIDTRDEQRDGHLRSADFFNVTEYPTLTFVSKSVQPQGGEEYLLVGDLTMHGVTKEVAFQLTFEGQGKDPWGNERIGFSAETKVNRKDFGLEWNAALESGGVLVGEQVKISIQVEAVKQA